ncbi:MAG: N-acetylglucosamine kinase [Hyphomicrobiales bacterium]|nr:N-acetylglucosamine kinase [Hyphomicrobiales bacterium]
MTYLLGIDGGGTTCRAALATADGTVIARAKSGSANIHTNFAGARENIIDAARQAFAEAGIDLARMSEARAVLGLAGANVGTHGRQLEATLPFAKSRVETDAMIALEGAVGGGDGAIAILGTGTAYLGRRDGVARPIGGWGFLIGDHGSGAQLGRELMERTLLAYDGVGPASPLTDEILAVFQGDPGNVVGFAATAKPGDFGGFAPKVFEHAAKGDAVAEAILGRGQAIIEASLTRFALGPDEPLSLLGGLAPLYEPRLSEPLRRLIRPPLQDALGGAVSMARRLFATVSA